MRKLRTHDKYEGVEGDVFSRLKLIKLLYACTVKNKIEYVVSAECICGSVGDYSYKDLKNGDVVSCGCTRTERHHPESTHKMFSYHPLNGVLKGMKGRCYNSKDDRFSDYGARGIRICDEWLNDSKAFFYWALNNGWKRGLDLDRKDNNGDYTPDNCWFTTRSNNNRNRRNNILITAFGETKVLMDWVNDPRCPLSHGGLSNRFKRGKWTNMEDMISTPLETRDDVSRNCKRTNNLFAFGEWKCITDWVKDHRCLVSQDAIRRRMRKGMTAEEAMTAPVPKNARYKDGKGLMSHNL